MIVSLCALAQRNTSQIRKLQDIKKGQATLPISGGIHFIAPHLFAGVEGVGGRPLWCGFRT
jgi:hypothetical protein